MLALLIAGVFGMSVAPAFAQTASNRATWVDDGGLQWRTDFRAAMQRGVEAKSDEMMFVVLHEAGETGNESMFSAYENAKFANSLKEHGMQPYLACSGTSEDSIRENALRFGVSVESLRDGHREILIDLFGPMADVPTPQFLAIHPQHGVLWHEVRVTSLKVLTDGMLAARALAELPAARRKTALLKNIKALCKTADTVPETRVRLDALLHVAPAAVFKDLVHAVAKADKALVQAVVEKLGQDWSAPVASRRLAGLKPQKVGAWLVELRQEIEARKPKRFGKPLSERLKSLGAMDSFDAVQWVANEPDMSPEAKVLTLIWLFDPYENRPSEQAEAQADDMKLSASMGVRVVAIACPAREVSDEELIEATLAAGFECPVGFTRYNEYGPFAGVQIFPASVLIDDENQVVYRTAPDFDIMKARWADYSRTLHSMIASDFYGGIRAPTTQGW